MSVRIAVIANTRQVDDSDGVEGEEVVALYELDDPAGHLRVNAVARVGEFAVVIYLEETLDDD